ncbi:DinB family protein [Ferruginibacter sp. SUN106]|uniref:DinB family protein n=1 Tax=Ferruginibacter sp. SUN106 TaxID=2978348 RepID=UPI003D361F1E
MKELLQQYAGYNVWANNILFERIRKLSEEKIQQEIVSSFPSVYKTIVHMWQAENIWWQRLQLVENISPLSETFKGSFADAVAGLALQSRQWADWVNGANDTQLTDVFAFVRNKEPFTMKVNDMLLHLFNHATFHRGQLVTLLRQLGETDNIPSTDFSTYTRLKN